jgi:hypothetical protein
VSDDWNLEAVSKFLTGTGVAAGGALFTVTGFLATRAYLSALGIPEHAAISVTEYLQYGGRIIFVLAMQLAPIMALVLLAAAPLLGYAQKFADVSRGRILICLAVAIVAAVSVYVEFSMLSVSGPVFSNGRVQSPADAQRFELLGAEIMTAITVLAMLKWGAQLWNETSAPPSRRALVLAVVLLTGTQVFLLPLCFGQVSMIPRSFDRVVLSREKDQPAVQGALVFSDSSAHFVFTPDKNLVEVPRSSIKEIRYVGRASVKDLDRWMHTLPASSGACCASRL